VNGPRIYIEGGSDNSKKPPRENFSKLISDPSKKRTPRVVICGSRGQALRQFRNDTNARSVALIDSEAPFSVGNSVMHLLARRDIDQTTATLLDANRVFLMVETMENWLIADMESIAAVLKSVKTKPAIDARARVLGNVENISKQTAESTVAACLPPKWSKGKRMELVGHLDPEVVRARSAEAERLFQFLGY
jgi:Domain of unknown function (DUF4276)